MNASNCCFVFIFLSLSLSLAEPILIDSDTEASRSAEEARTIRKSNKSRIERNLAKPVRRKLMCFCTSIYCRNCLNENARKKLFRMYSCHPIITTHIRMCETVGLLMNLPQDKVRRIFSRLSTYLLMRNDDPFDLKQNRALKGYEGNFPRTMAPLEVCQIKRKLLAAKPIWFAKTLTQSLRIFRYKIDTTEMISTLMNAGQLKFRRITNRISKKAKLIAIEDCQSRIKRIQYIRTIQRFRREQKRIIYINAMLIGDKMILIAASADGPITSAFIKCTNASGFLNWLSKDIVENVKDPCVFVLGPSCIFRDETNIPQQTDSKVKIIAWLRNQNIIFDETLYKTELYDLILQHCKDYPAETFYTINDYLKSRMNQDVLHIPNGNSDLDPYDYLWFQIKLRMIASNETASFNINRQFCSLPKEIWCEQFQRIQAIENSYLQIERNFDRTYRRFRVDNDDFKTDEILHAVDYVETC